MTQQHCTTLPPPPASLWGSPSLHSVFSHKGHRQSPQYGVVQKEGTYQKFWAISICIHHFLLTVGKKKGWNLLPDRHKNILEILASLPGLTSSRQLCVQVRQAPSYRVCQTTRAHPVTRVETQIFAQRTLKRIQKKTKQKTWIKIIVQ